MKTYDFRSDTVTRPTEKMRQAMANAEVGDDVYGDDPTVNRLEAESAELLGKEAGLFVTSGTMGNLLACMTVCRRGDEILMGEMGHTFLHEAGGVSVLGSLIIHTVPNQADGTLRLEDLQDGIRPDDIHQPPSRMIILENTQNVCGGIAIPLHYEREVGQFAKKRGLFYHLDGARVFNAAIKLGVSVAEVAEPFDSVTFCLSKGLCAPVGSVLCGEKGFIKEARRIRKMLGGGMRQAGVLAAAGLIAIHEMVDRLAEDHERAIKLAGGLKQVPGVTLEKGSPHTNMVFISLSKNIDLSSRQFLSQMAEEGILFSESGRREFRLVTHHDVDDTAVEACIAAFHKVLG